MLRYFIKRFLMMIPVLIGVSIIVFLIQVLAPGDPADVILGTNVTEEAKYEWKDQYGLNDPIIIQYADYMFNLIAKGDLGRSYRDDSSINATVSRAYPISITISFFATCIACLIGIPLGIISAKKRGKFLDAAARIIGILGISLPIFWFAYLMIMLFAQTLKWLPVSGLYGPKYYILPCLVVGILSSASILRITRTSMLDALSQDYVRTARSKGQTEHNITFHHILRNALIPITNAIGNQLANNVGNTSVIETVFVINGMGILSVSAINNRDYALLRAVVLMFAITVSVVNILIDVVYMLIDPRVKARFTSGKKHTKAVVKG